MARMQSWTSDFGSYRVPVNEGRIERWLKQFAAKDKDLAARVLDAVDYFDAQRTAAAFTSLLGQLAGWDVSPARRNGTWRFVAFSSSAGESGDEMLRRFRHANRLARTSFSELFVHRSQLLQQSLSAEDTVVFVDDFAGTGDQVVAAWPELQELLPTEPDVHLLLVAATEQAVKRINKETGLIATAEHVLRPNSNVFHRDCHHFTNDEKDTLLEYCAKADSKRPKGYGETGLLVVFNHGCPNNSIAALHSVAPNFEGLFRRSG